MFYVETYETWRDGRSSVSWNKRRRDSKVTPMWRLSVFLRSDRESGPWLIGPLSNEGESVEVPTLLPGTEDREELVKGVTSRRGLVSGRTSKRKVTVYYNELYSKLNNKNRIVCAPTPPLFL